jgi:hypothetical protein
MRCKAGATKRFLATFRGNPYGDNDLSPGHEGLERATFF